MKKTVVFEFPDNFKFPENFDSGVYGYGGKCVSCPFRITTREAHGQEPPNVECFLLHSTYDKCPFFGGEDTIDLEELRKMMQEKKQEKHASKKHPPRFVRVVKNGMD